MKIKYVYAIFLNRITISEQSPLTLILDYKNKLHRNKEQHPFPLWWNSYWEGFDQAACSYAHLSTDHRGGDGATGVGTLIECFTRRMTYCIKDGSSPTNRAQCYTCMDMRGKSLGWPNNGGGVQSRDLNFFVFEQIICLHRAHQGSTQPRP